MCSIKTLDAYLSNFIVTLQGNVQNITKDIVHHTIHLVYSIPDVQYGNKKR